MPFKETVRSHLKRSRYSDMPCKVYLGAVQEQLLTYQETCNRHQRAIDFERPHLTDSKNWSRRLSNPATVSLGLTR